MAEHTEHPAPPAEKIERLRQAMADYAEAGTGELFDEAEEKDKAPVRKRALGLLDQRSRSRHELRERLLSAEFEPDVIDEVLSDLDGAGLINDRTFATEWVRQRHHGRGKSRRVLDRELQEKGVASDLRQEALAQIEIADEESMAQKLAAKKANSVKAAPEGRAEYDKMLRRIVGVLARRGFPSEMTMRLSRNALDDRIAEITHQDF